MKRFFILLAAVFFVCFGASAEEIDGISEKEKIFTLNPIADAVLLGSGAALSGADLVLDNIVKLNRSEYSNEIFYKDDVNAFDRYFMHSYSASKDKAADFLLAASIATPLALIPSGKSEWLTEGIMYAETLLIANGIKEITKLCVNRTRPYMYYDSSTWPEKDVDSGDYANSFPSGHTTIAFASASFTSYVFSRYFPDSVWKYPVIAGSYAFAAGTSALRLFSGNHFMTDVLTGAAIGSAVGFLVPWLHTFNSGHDLKVTALGNGILFKVDL